MKKAIRPLHWIVGLLLTSAMLAAAVTFTLHFRPLYVHDVHAYDLPAYTGLSEETILEQYDVLIDYNSIGGAETLAFPDLPSSEVGLIHFEETKVIFLAFQWWAVIGTVLTVIGILLLRRQQPHRFLKYAGLVSLIFPVVVGVGVALMWDKVFVLFHEIMFRNDYWLFNAQTDPIVLLLPDGYFMHCAVLIIALFILGGIICLVLYALLCRRAKRRVPAAV